MGVWQRFWQKLGSGWAVTQGGVLPLTLSQSRILRDGPSRTTLEARADPSPLAILALQEPNMPKSMISPKTEARVDAVASAPVAPAAIGRSKPATATQRLVERLAKARTANEITNVIGLKPIKGRSGPKIAY